MTSPITNGPRIDRSGIGAVSGNKSAESQSNAASADGPRTDGGVDAQTGQSERLQAMRAAIDGTPAVDHSRVEQIRDQIARGEYPLNPDRIAQRFAELEKLVHG